MSGFGMALDEVTLVFFTALAPSGAVALMIMAGVLLLAKLDAAERAAIDKWLFLPLALTMLGLVASATHLGNPSNALYVFLNVGQSPLSNEIVCAVLFLMSAGLYWLYSFALKPSSFLRRTLQVLMLVFGAAFVTAVAFAYSVDTVPTWSLPVSPLLLWLNALVGGPVFAVTSLYVARWRPVASVFGRVLGGVSFVALAGNAAGYFAQGALIRDLENAVVSAAALVPSYGAMCCVSLMLAFAGCLLSALALRRVAQGVESGLPLVVSKRIFCALLVSCALVFAAVFTMRFAFYMMHLTVGVAF